MTPEVVAHDLHPGVPVDEVRRGARRGAAHRRPAPPRPPGGVPRRARRSRPRGRGDLRRDGLRAGRHGVGRGAAGAATRAASSGRGTCGRCGCRAASRRCASRGGWRARGCRRRRGRSRRRCRGVDARRWEAIAGLARGELAAPVTTSMGRLFDAVAALCGDPPGGELRGAGGDRAGGGRSARATTAATRCPALDARPAVLGVERDLRAGDEPERGGRAVPRHGGGRDSRRASRSRRRERGLGTAVLSGGVFLNRRLLEGTACSGCARAGLRVLVPERLPPGDGGIAFGQAAVAAAVDNRSQL